MPFDLSLPLFAASGLALAAVVTYFGWPHIRVRTYNKTHGDLRVINMQGQFRDDAGHRLVAARRKDSVGGDPHWR